VALRDAPEGGGWVSRLVIPIYLSAIYINRRGSIYIYIYTYWYHVYK